MKSCLTKLTPATLLGFTLLLAGCGDSGSSAISQVSGAVAPAALKTEAEVPADRGAESSLVAGNLGRVDALSGDVTMERCMAQRRYLVFHTNEALDAVNDTNGTNDVYLRDLLTGTVTLVSKSGAGAAGNGASSYATISSDGKKIAYQSLASNLVTGDTNGKSDVFLYDRLAGTTIRVSLSASNAEGNDDSSFPALNSDGSLVAFVSKSDLTGVGASGIPNLYLRKINGSSTRLFTRGSGTGANAPVYTPVMTNDSRYIAYMSAASNLVGGDSNGANDIFLYDRSTGLTERVSVDSAGQQANGNSIIPSISDDGNLIAYESKASNLVANDSNGLRDLFVRNRTAGTTTRVSVDAAGAQLNGISYHATLTRDGSRVAFASQASNLVAGDSNNVADVFQRLVTDPTTIARASRNIVGDVQGDGPSDLPSYDSDDNDLTFRSSSTNLDWANVVSNNEIFLANRASGTASVVGSQANSNLQKTSDSVFGAGSNTGDSATTGGQCFSADGRYQVFTSFSANLVPSISGNLLKIYVKDRKTGLNVYAGEGYGSLGAYDGIRFNGDHLDRVQPAISADGRFLAYQTNDPNFITSRALYKSVLRRQLSPDRLERVTPPYANGDSYSASISADGTTVVFTSKASNLVPDDTNNCSDVFVFRNGTISRVSVNSAGQQANALSYSTQCAVSGDGRFVTFTSNATNLDSNQIVPGTFVHDCQTGRTWCVSINMPGQSYTPPWTQLYAENAQASISQNGRYVAFTSMPIDWSKPVNLDERRIFVSDLQTDRIQPLGPDQGSSYLANLLRFAPCLSADGRWVAYSAYSWKSSANDYRFLQDRQSQVTLEISNENMNRYAYSIDGIESAGISPDGRYLTWNSRSTTLVPNDLNTWSDVFARLIQLP